MSDGDKEKRERGPVLGCLATALILALPAYVLSIGPALWLHERGYIPAEASIIYFPLGLLSDNCKPIEDFFQWYTRLWGA
jgi:hypothetical protein